MSSNPPISFPSQAEVEQLFHAQREYAPLIARSSSRERLEKLQKIYDYLVEHEADIIAALRADFKKPEVETLLSESGVVLSNIRYIRKRLSRWMKPKKVSTPLLMFGTNSYVHYESKGQALIISPWNYPLLLALLPATYAIAAGCTVILKPSEYSVHTAAFLQKMVAELFDPREFALVQGEGPTAAALTEMPFNHIFFTGSPQVGKMVMKAASKNLASVTLELGGKSPAVIDDNIDIKDTASRTCWGKFFNGGQTCVAPDYALVHEDRAADFKVAMREKISDFFGENPKDSNSLARIINNRHFQRLQEILDDALEKGAELITGGVNDPEECYFAPTVLSGVTEDMRVMQEEIFGPILPIVTFDTLEKAVEIINRRPKPLTMYINSKRQKNIDYLVKHTSAGSTTINDYLLNFANPNLPLGGVNNSGIGKSMGYHGFIEFTNERNMVHRRFLDASFTYPPYDLRKTKIARLIYKWL